MAIPVGRLHEEKQRKGLRVVGAQESPDKVYRGEVWMADLGDENIIDSEQRGERPVIVIQNDTGNKFSTTTIVACFTTQTKTSIPTHMEYDLQEPSTILFEQLKTISKKRLKKRIKRLTKREMDEVNQKIKISLGL